MSQSTLKMKGFDGLIRKLNALPKAGAKRAARKATRAGTTVLAKAVRAAVPVDKGVLKRMETSKVGGRGSVFYGLAGADVEKLKTADTAAGAEHRPSNIDWLVENGHVTPDGVFVPPTGFMRRAADSAMPVAEQAYIRKLTTEIEREAQVG